MHNGWRLDYLRTWQHWHALVCASGGWLSHLVEDSASSASLSPVRISVAKSRDERIPLVNPNSSLPPLREWSWNVVIELNSRSEVASCVLDSAAGRLMCPRRKVKMHPFLSCLCVVEDEEHQTIAKQGVKQRICKKNPQKNQKNICVPEGFYGSV